MIDLRLLRDDPDTVRASQTARGDDPALVDVVLDADARRRAALTDFERLRAEQKSLGKEVARAQGDEKHRLLSHAKSLAEQVKAGTLEPAAIDDALINGRLYTADQPDPDLMIRTSGEARISNFLLWQLAYTELWFTETLWPALDAATLQRALDDFASRERRFGLTGAQVAGAHNGMTPA